MFRSAALHPMVGDEVEKGLAKLKAVVEAVRKS
jgi:hypothetical protein